MWLGFFLGILATLLSVTLASMFAPEMQFFYIVRSNLATIQAAGSLAVASSALVAFCVYRSTVRRHAQDDERKASAEYLSESIRLLERAYSIFTNSGEDTRPPPNDRLIWLSTSRMLVRFKKIRSNVTISEHKAIADESEEYWRLQFYSLLRENRENFTASYFQPSGDRHAGDTIPRRAIAIIFAFARWPEGQPDPLDTTDDKQLFADGAIPIDFGGVITFLEQYEEYWAEVLEIRQRQSRPS